MADRKPTARDVAERAGVSRSMVSMYLSRNPNLWISEETKARLEAAIRELGYRPNRTAQILRGGKSHVIGLVLGGISGPFASCLSEALMETMEEAGYRLLLGVTRYDPERERRVLESMMNFELDALVYTLEPEYGKDLLLQCAKSMPVFLTEKREDLPFHCVDFDLRGAMADALHFLAARNVERVALLTNRIGIGEREFLAREKSGLPERRSFRFPSSRGDAEEILRELVGFQPDAVISLAGIHVAPALKRLGPETLLVDAWSLPFQRLKMEKIRPAGSIVRPFREYAEILAESLLEALRSPECGKLVRSVPALFLKWKEQKLLREKLLNEPYYQAFEHS